MVGQTSDSSDTYVTGGVNWSGFTLAELVAMVEQRASVPQLHRLAQDWRETGDAVVDAADFLADALDNLMNYWTGESAEMARHVVALNAQWVSDLGTTAHEMSVPIEEAAGALQAAQAAMPDLPEQLVPTTWAESRDAVSGAAPHAAADLGAATGSPLAAAIAASSESTRSGLDAHARRAELKQIAVETMQRFETAAVGIDRSTPRFLGQDTDLRPGFAAPEVEPEDPVDSTWVSSVTRTSGVDLRWQVLTGVLDPSTGAPYPNGGFGSGGTGSYAGGGFGGMSSGGIGGVPLGQGSGRAGQRVSGRPELGGLPARPMSAGASGAVIGATGGGTGSGYHGGPMAAPMGAGMGAGNGTEPHRRRFPFDADDPFDTGQKASPPVIGL